VFRVAAFDPTDTDVLHLSDWATRNVTEALFNQIWAGVLFGAAASWQPGESSIEDFQKSYGRAFFGDTTGKIDAAERLLMSAHDALQKAGLGEGSDALYWRDPWSAERGHPRGALCFAMDHGGLSGEGR